jgi:WD repeat-containing protein 19
LFFSNRLAPEETPIISKEYGQQLEFTADYPAALLHYERGILAHFRQRCGTVTC